MFANHSFLGARSFNSTSKAHAWLPPKQKEWFVQVCQRWHFPRVHHLHGHDGTILRVVWQKRRLHPFYDVAYTRNDGRKVISWSHLQFLHWNIEKPSKCWIELSIELFPCLPAFQLRCWRPGVGGSWFGNPSFFLGSSAWCIRAIGRSQISFRSWF